MKHSTSFHRRTLPGILSLTLGLAIAHAQQPDDGAAEAIENSDPFTKGSAKTPATNPSAEMLDAQARVLFERGEKEKAIALQALAVEKANEMVAKFSETLAKYEGRPVDGPISRKLREIVIPMISFEDTSVEEAMDFLRLRSIELDKTETDPVKRGVNIVIGNLDNQPLILNEDSPRIKRLQLRNVSLGDALKYICEATHLRYRIDGNAVMLLTAVAP